MEVLPPLDWEKTGGETWGDVAVQIKQVGTGKVAKGLLFGTNEERLKTWDGIFRPVRQPEWWQGDSEYHAPKIKNLLRNWNGDLSGRICGCLRNYSAIICLDQ